MKDEHVHYLPNNVAFIVPFCLCSNNGSTVYDQLPVLEEKEMDTAHAHITSDGTVLSVACKCLHPFANDPEDVDIKRFANLIDGEGSFTEHQNSILQENSWVKDWMRAWFYWYSGD